MHFYYISYLLICTREDHRLVLFSPSKHVVVASFGEPFDEHFDRLSYLALIRAIIGFAAR